MGKGHQLKEQADDPDSKLERNPSPHVGRGMIQGQYSVVYRITL